MQKNADGQTTGVDARLRLLSKLRADGFEAMLAHGRNSNRQVQFAAEAQAHTVIECFADQPDRYTFRPVSAEKVLAGQDVMGWDSLRQLLAQHLPSR